MSIKTVELRDPHFSGFRSCPLPLAKEFGIQLDDGDHHDSERVPVKWDGLLQRQAVQQMIDAMLQAVTAGVPVEDIRQAAASVSSLVSRNEYQLVPGATTLGLFIVSPQAVNYVVSLGHNDYLVVAPGVSSEQMNGSTLERKYAASHVF